jgi:hypothetical protein
MDWSVLVYNMRKGNEKHKTIQCGKCKLSLHVLEDFKLADRLPEIIRTRYIPEQSISGALDRRGCW